MNEIIYKYKLVARTEYAEQLKAYFEKFLRGTPAFMAKAEEFKKSFIEKGYTEDDIKVVFNIKIDDYINSGQIWYQTHNQVEVVVSVPETSLSHWFGTDRHDITSPQYTKERNQAGAEILKLMNEAALIMKAEAEEKKKQESDEMIKKAATDKKQSDIREAANKINREKRLAWAQIHGSAHLRKGLDQGYTCIKQYEHEYGAWVLGTEYIWDREDVVEEKERSCPSLEALEIVEVLVRDDRIGSGMADIKWLPDGLSALTKDEDWDEDTKKGCEAVSVKINGITGLWYKVMT